MDLPVLIYIAKDGCSACIKYSSEWEKIKTALNGRARFIKFTFSPPNLLIPPPLAKYGGWAPSIILAGPKSYFRCYTPNDQINTDEYADNYTIRGKKFNSVEADGGYQYAYRPNTADNTILWFNQVVDDVLNNDEPTPPRRYASKFI